MTSLNASAIFSRRAVPIQRKAHGKVALFQGDQRLQQMPDADIHIPGIRLHETRQKLSFAGGGAVMVILG